MSIIFWYCIAVMCIFGLGVLLGQYSTERKHQKSNVRLFLVNKEYSPIPYVNQEGQTIQ